MLFSRGVSGTRVVGVGRWREARTVDGHAFAAYGAHADDYPTPYLTAAAAVGMSAADVHTLLTRIESTILEYMRQRERAHLRADLLLPLAIEAPRVLCEPIVEVVSRVDVGFVPRLLS
jgi:hypothetical protein